MGQITTGIGLVSGIDTASLIDQLLALESRPKTLITQRNAVLNSQNVAFQDISAKLLSFKLGVSSIITNKSFDATSSTSSNPDKVGISSGSSATPGSYNFTVSQLVTTQQLLTRGYADTESTPVGAGTMTFEFGDAKLETDTDLAQLNGGEGVSRGKIRITDRSGNSAVVDLSKALTTNDVIEAINNTDGINVTAAVDDGQFIINDETGAAISNLSVADVGTTGTASSLGLVSSVAADTLTGANINQLGNKSLLSSLNDNNGVGIRLNVPDMRFDTRDGSAFTIDLAGATTVGALIQKVSDQTSGAVIARVNAAGTGLELEDTTAGGGTFTVTALNDSTAAADLGLLQADGDLDGIITGGRRLAALNTRLLGSLKGGSGVGLGEINITNRAGVATAVDLSAAESVADVLKLINNAGAGVKAQVNRAGHGIEIVDTTGSTAANLTIADNTGTAATDLGLAQSVDSSNLDSGNLQLQYVSGSTRLASLNSGAGVTRGLFKITDSAGVSASVDLTQGNEITISDVLSEINSRGLAINARVNDNGDGIVIEDTGPGTFAIKVEEEGGTIARDLGLLGEAANPGDDFVGSFERTVEIEAGDTLKDLAQKINDSGLRVTASIINTGSQSDPFRLSLLSKTPGSAGKFVFDDGGLNLEATTLVEAQNAVAFFGSADPTKAIPITSSKNTLESLIPGATISLLGTTDTPVTVTINQDDSKALEGVKKIVNDFNTIVDTLKKYDSYNSETQQRGLLLGDSTVARIQSSLYRILNGRQNDVGGQFKTLASIGITIGSGAKLQFNETKFNQALSNDRQAVVELLSKKQTETVDGKVNLIAGGALAKLENALEGLTSNEGALQSQINSINKQIEGNKKQITNLDAKLEAKRLILQNQFAAMERALSDLQSQGSALANFSPIPLSGN